MLITVIQDLDLGPGKSIVDLAVFRLGRKDLFHLEEEVQDLILGLVPDLGKDLNIDLIQDLWGLQEYQDNIQDHLHL